MKNQAIFLVLCLSISLYDQCLTSNLNISKKKFNSKLSKDINTTNTNSTNVSDKTSEQNNKSDLHSENKNLMEPKQASKTEMNLEKASLKKQDSTKKTNDSTKSLSKTVEPSKTVELSKTVEPKKTNLKKAEKAKSTTTPQTTTGTRKGYEFPKNGSLEPYEDAVLGLEDPDVIEGNCFVRIKGWYYNLNPAYTAQSLENGKNTLIWNQNSLILAHSLCRDIPAEEECPEVDSTILDKNSCTSVAGSHKVDKVWVAEMGGDVEKITLTLPQGSACNIDGQFYQTTVELTCDPSVDNLELDFNTGSTDSCTNTITGRSRHACRISLHKSWYSRLGVDKKVVGGFLILIGLFFLIFGNTFFKFTSSLIIVGLFGMIFKGYTAGFFEMNIFMALGLGVIVAAIVLWWTTATNIVLGIIAGFLVGTICNNFTLKWFDADPDLVYNLTITFWIIIALIFGAIFEKVISVFITSLIGGYVGVRGLSLLCGGFPDESYTSALIKYKEFNQVSRIFGGPAFTYLIGMLVATILGMIIQGGINLAKDDEPASGDKVDGKADNDEKEGLKENVDQNKDGEAKNEGGDEPKNEEEDEPKNEGGNEEPKNEGGEEEPKNEDEEPKNDE